MMGWNSHRRKLCSARPLRLAFYLWLFNLGSLHGVIYFIRWQQKKLRNYALEILNAKSKFKASTPYVSEALQNANDAYQIYALHTKTLRGKFLSFIPGTHAFKTRLNCANKIKLATAALKNAEERIDAAAKKWLAEFDKIETPAPATAPVTAPHPIPAPAPQTKSATNQQESTKLSNNRHTFWISSNKKDKKQEYAEDNNLEPPIKCKPNLTLTRREE